MERKELGTIAARRKRNTNRSWFQGKYIARAIAFCVVLATMHTLFNRDFAYEISDLLSVATLDFQQDISFPKLFLKTRGSGWRIWHNSDSPLAAPDHLNLTCQWTEFKAKYDPPLGSVEKQRTDNLPPISMCIHRIVSDRWVSGSILQIGRWKDCDSLTYWYDNSGSSDTGGGDWYIDIGANIGSCVLQVLLTTDAKIAAFEPDPRNLFRLTSTISKLPAELRKRVYVFPVALGAGRGVSEMHVAADNHGNAVVGQQIKDAEHVFQRFLEPLPVPIERMDDLLDASRGNIRLVKLDSQGYECYIARGMIDFLKRVKTVMFEMEKIMLRSFANCSEVVLWNIFEEFEKFTHHSAFGGSAHHQVPVQEMPDIGAIDIVARRDK